MRFENIELTEMEFFDSFDWDTGKTISSSNIDFVVPDTNELVEELDKIRKKLGNTDLQDGDNDVYYNFYLNAVPKAMFVRLIGICNHGEKDDYNDYNIELTPEEEKMLTWKVIKALSVELRKEN